MHAELNRLNAQLGKALEGDAWHGPSVLDTLKGVTVEQAAAHPIAGAHSIWELVLHLCGTYDLVLRRLGGDGRQLTESEDWPSVPEARAENWSVYYVAEDIEATMSPAGLCRAKPVQRAEIPYRNGFGWGGPSTLLDIV